MLFDTDKKCQSCRGLHGSWGSKASGSARLNLNIVPIINRMQEAETQSRFYSAIGLQVAVGIACSGTSKQPKEIEYHEETEGFLSYRIADRRGDHSDHRGHRYSELAALENRSERIIRGGLSSHHQHRGSDVSVELGQRFRGRFDAAGRSLPLYRSDFGRSLPNRPALERCSSHQERLCLQRSRHSLST